MVGRLHVYRLIWRIGLGAAITVSASPALAEGPLEFGAALGTSWYDHRSQESSRLGLTTFTLRTLRPFVRYDGSVGGWDLRGQAQRRFEFYSGDGIDTLFKTDNHAHDRVNLFAARRWSERDEVSAEGAYVHSRDMLEGDQGSVLPDGSITRWSGALASRASLFEGGARLRVTSYDNDSTLRDSRAIGWNGRVIPFRRAYDAVFFGIAGSQLDIGEAPVLIGRMASVGYRRQVAPLLTAEAEVGAVETRFADGVRQRLPMFALGLERDPGRGSALAFALQARFEGDSAAALSAEGRYHMAGGRLRLRAESLADAEGGIYRHATRTRRFTLEVQDTLARANVLGFEGSYTRTRDLRGDEKGTEILRTTAWAMRRVQPWLNFRIAASYLREPLGARYFEPVFRRIRLDLELIVLSGGLGSSTFRALEGLRPGQAE
jgi:hypothetical protein